MNPFKYAIFKKEYLLYLGMVVVGIGLMVVGGIVTYAQTKSELHPEFVSTGVPLASPQSTQTIVVDVAGAVVNPGVYRFSMGVRVAEVLDRAGGLSDQADSGYVARQINLAGEVTDGVKIYIPVMGEQVEAIETGGQSGGVISINRASASELEALWGVGPARAAAIITHRPYTLVEELVTKARLPQAVLDNNPGKISL